LLPTRNHWLKFIADRGARIADGRVRDFGDREAEMAATSQGSIVADLGHLGLLTITGEDASDFLHAQLSCDVQGLTSDQATWGCYCSPKGRVLANFLLWRMSDGFGMLLPAEIVASVQKRLQMFVLRSKVKLAERTAETVVLGLTGSEAMDTAARLVGTMPRGDLSIAYRDGLSAIALPGQRVILVGAVEQAQGIWPQLAAAFRPVGTDRWMWLDIVHRLPWIGLATQDQFVPQMANLELIGAINFRKGCYPGQEIVARTQYLGTPKRRLALAHVATEAPPAEGSALVAEDDTGQSAGVIVNAARAPEGGFDLLAVVQTARMTSALRLAAGGPLLEIRALPYSVA
jgi:folate-binding protein YgfZ